MSKGSAISQPPRSPDLFPCDFYLYFKFKDRFYLNYPHTLKEIHQKFETAIIDICQAELLRLSHSLVIPAQSYVNVEGSHFEHFLLWTVLPLINKGQFHSSLLNIFQAIFILSTLYVYILIS